MNYTLLYLTETALGAAADLLTPVIVLAITVCLIGIVADLAGGAKR